MVDVCTFVNLSVPAVMMEKVDELLSLYIPNKSTIATQCGASSDLFEVQGRLAIL